MLLLERDIKKASLRHEVGLSAGTWTKLNKGEEVSLSILLRIDVYKRQHPVSGKKYTLTVQELEQQTISEKRYGSDRWFYPTHFTAMSYTCLLYTSGTDAEE